MDSPASLIKDYTKNYRIVKLTASDPKNILTIVWVHNPAEKHGWYMNIGYPDISAV